jgi:hypothetical protein
LLPAALLPIAGPCNYLPAFTAYIYASRQLAFGVGVLVLNAIDQVNAA